MIAILGDQILDARHVEWPALAEKQPGFAKVFFYLEQEVMKPRYEIHSVTLPEAISSAEPAESSRRDRAARALFSATELVRTNNPPLEFGRTVPQNKYREFAARYQTRLRAEIDRTTELQKGDQMPKATKKTVKKTAAKKPAAKKAAKKTTRKAAKA